MISAKITKQTKDKALILWEEDGEFGNIKIEYTEGGKFLVDAEYIGLERLLRVLKNLK